MKKKISQEELSRLRKKEQSRKDMESELGRDLKLQSDRQEAEDRFYSNYNRLGIAAINFFGTLFILNIPFRLAQWIFPGRIPFTEVYHVVFLLVALVSAFRRKSLLDRWFP